MSPQKNSQKSSAPGAGCKEIPRAELLTSQARCHRTETALEERLARLDQTIEASCDSQGTTIEEARQVIRGYLERCEPYARLDLSDHKEAARLLGAIQAKCETELSLLEQRICTGPARREKISSLMFSLKLCFR